MRLASRLLPALSVAALAFPAAAAAAPPVNDHYLASLPVDRVEFQTTADTTEATTQSDLFNPSRDGAPLGGGKAENTTCKGTPFGKTVWYDLAPQANGSVDISASAVGFRPVVALYEWSQADSGIKRMVDCTDTAGGRLQLDVKRGRNYTIQVGGAGGLGGAVTLSVDYFPDQDADGELDALDECPTVPGIARFSGCPPELRAVPSIGFDRTGNGVVLRRLVVDRVPRGAKLVARCTGCGSETVRAKRSGRVTLTKLVGRSLRPGTSIELRITLRRTGKGTYRFGATGSYFKWPVRASGLGPRVTRCLAVKTGKIERCK